MGFPHSSCMTGETSEIHDNSITINLPPLQDASRGLVMSPPQICSHLKFRHRGYFESLSQHWSTRIRYTMTVIPPQPQMCLQFVIRVCTLTFKQYRLPRCSSTHAAKNVPLLWAEGIWQYYVTHSTSLSSSLSPLGSTFGSGVIKSHTVFFLFFNFW